MKKNIKYFFLALFALVCFAACEQEITIPEASGYKTPTITGTVSLPDSSGLSLSDIWVKVIDSNGQTKNVSKASSDGSFAISGLNENEQYEVFFTSVEPEHTNYSSKDIGVKETKGYGGWLGNVSAAVEEGNNVGSVKMKPLGTIKGKALISGMAEHYDVTIYIPGTSYIARTDKDGSFSIYNVPEGTYQLRYTLDDHLPVMSDSVILASAGGEKDNPVTTVPTVTMISNEGTVEGFAVLDGIEDSSGILIRLEESEGSNNYTATTAKNGYFSIDGIKPGEYRLLCSYSGYPSQTSSYFKVNAAQTTTLGERVVLFENVGTITGNASLFDDDNVKSGINISIVGVDNNRSYTAMTDDSGYFNKLVNPGSYTVSASYAGYSTQSLQITVYQGASANAVIPGLLPADGAISGSVVLEGSIDSSGVVVTAVNALDATKKANAVTDSDGSFSIRGLKSAGQYYLTYSKEGYIKNSSVVANVSLGNVCEVETVALKSTTSKISGTISLESAKDNTGITVLLKASDGSLQYSTSTDQKGGYTFNRVLPGSYVLYASKAGYETRTSYDIVVEPSVDKTLDSQSLAVAIRSISGSVSLEGKDDHAGALITATNTSDGALIYSAITNSDGNYVLAGMVPGEYNISISSAAYNAIALPTVNVVANSTASLGKAELLLARGKIAGLVKLEGYTDYSGVKVSLLGTEYETTSSKDGSYEFNVPSGNYPGGIRYEKADMETTSYTATVPVLTASTYAIPDVELKALSVPVVRGQLTVKNATSVAFGGITVKLVEKPEFSFTTDDDGSWILEHVPLGDYTLEITRENTRKVTMNISVEAVPEIVIGTIELIPDAASIEGNIALKSVSDYSGVTVRAKSADGDEVKTTTNAAGYFYLGNILSSKEYTVYFEKAGWNTQSMPISGLEPLSLTDITANTSIELIDTEKPIFTDMTIIPGASVAEGRKVYIYAEAEDKGSGIKSIYINTANDFADVEAIAYTTPFEYIMPDVVGEQTVYAKVVDNAGNESTVASKAITLKNHKNEVSGVLTGDDLTWTKAKSPYYVTGNILVEEGNTLTIEAGVNVQFAGPYYLMVDGKLAAEGKADDKILIYGVNEGEDAWLGINVRKDYGSVIDNATIFGLAEGLAGKLRIVNSSVTAATGCNCLGLYKDWDDYHAYSGEIENSTISGGIYATGATFIDIDIYIVSDSSEISESYLLGNSIEGDSITISDSAIDNSIFEGMDIVLDGTGSIYSTFKSSSLGIRNGGSYFYDVFEDCEFGSFSGAFLKSSNLMDCGTISTNTARTSVEEYDFGANFWGYDKTTIMDVQGTNTNLSFISDYYDDFDKSKIKVEGYAKEPYESIGYKGDGYYSTTESEKEYKVGDTGPAGGLVFYDKGYYSAGWRYLEAAPSDIGTCIFGYYRPTDESEMMKSGTTVTIGTGRLNTELLVLTMGDSAYSSESGSSKTGNYAARLCSILEHNGYDNWFLPSRDELDLMYENLHAIGLGSFESSGYWSSSEDGNVAGNAWAQYFFSGDQGYSTCFLDYCIRPCRAF